MSHLELLLVRVALPAAIAVAGLLAIVLGSDSTATAFGVVLIGIAALVVLVDVFARLSLSSQDDRAAEERRRRTFTRTGRWFRG